MWQAKYTMAVPKNLGVGVDFRSFSEGDFLSRRSLCSVTTTQWSVKTVFQRKVNVLKGILSKLLLPLS